MAKLTSIFKMIGAQSSRLKTANDAIEYIFNSKKTTPDLCSEKYLDLDDPLASWSTHPMHKTEKERQFLHVLLCPYGEQIPSIAELKEIKKSVMEIFDEYPMFSSIHIDHASSPHIHLLIHPRNVFTDKVWQQSPSQLRRHKEAISNILTEFGLYGVLQQDEKSLTPNDANSLDEVLFDLWEENYLFDDSLHYDSNECDENIAKDLGLTSEIAFPKSPFQGVFTKASKQDLTKDCVKSASSNKGVFDFPIKPINTTPSDVVRVSKVTNGLLSIKRNVK